MMRSSGGRKMSPRKSRQDSTDRADYPTILVNSCREEDVLLVPIVQKLAPVCNVVRKGAEKTDLAPAPGETDDLCPPPSPPTIQVAYETCDSGECPVSILCKAFYVEYALIRAIFKSLLTFPTISSLKIEDCCVSRDVVCVFATLLADSSAKNVIDVSLDGNVDIVDMLPLLLRTDLKYLSLRRCNLDDKAVKLLSQELCYLPEREGKLLALNLNMNSIGDEGALALATALRTNRTLISLSLSGNQITDVGACYLAEVLGRFPLTMEEIMLRRRRIFDRLLLRKSILDRLLEERKPKNELENQTRIRSCERLSGKKAKSFDFGMKRASTSSRDRKYSSSRRMSSREKVCSKRKRGGLQRESISSEPTPSEIKEIVREAESEMPKEKHPFISEVTASENEIWCEGSWRLGNLNLSYNRITEYSVEKFLCVICYQEEKLEPPRHGLLRLIIQPGNPIPRNSCVISEVECALKNRSQRRWSQADGSVPALHAESLPKKK